MNKYRNRDNTESLTVALTHTGYNNCKSGVATRSRKKKTPTRERVENLVRANPF